MSEFLQDPESPAARKRREQTRFLYIAAWLLLGSALVFALLPLPIPRPIRIAVAGADLIAASVVWLAWRQRSRAQP